MPKCAETDIAVNTYYFEVQDGERIAPGVYSCRAKAMQFIPDHINYFYLSQRVWRQGPRGGVKIVRDNGWNQPTGYITNDPKWMQKFAWIKLKARPV